MSDRAGRGEQYRHKPCSPVREHSWGLAIPDLPYSVAILEPQSVCGRCRWAFPRASRRASQDLAQGPSGLSDWLAGLSSQTASNSIMRLIRRLESTSNLIEQRDGYDRHAGRPAFGLARASLETRARRSPPDTEASQQVTAGSGRIKHGGPAKGRASTTTHS